MKKCKFSLEIISFFRLKLTKKRNFSKILLNMGKDEVFSVLRQADACLPAAAAERFSRLSLEDQPQ